jgi:chemotaxis protein methyltransferase CheR
MTGPSGAPGTSGGSLDPAATAWVADLVRREAAIVLEGKEYLVDSRLAALSRRLGMPDAAAVVRAAQRGDRTSQAGIVDALTTNETSWFRDGGPFEALRRHVLPTLVRERAAERSLRIWSAACSSGQEAYSVAMVCREVVPPGWRVDILGTDLSREILDRARAGRYSQLEVNRGLPAPLLVQWMRRVGTEWEVVPELREMVRWDRLNLARPFPPLGRFDIVLLRNVLIYFDPPTKGAVLDRARGVLRPDGYLLLGGAETTIGLGDTWQREVVAGAPVWRLAGAPPLAPAPAAAPLASASPARLATPVPPSPRRPLPSPVPQRGGR